MQAQSQTHATLLARVADGGDPTAWTEFCARYGDTIRGFAVRQGLQGADCEDIVQDVLVALTKSLPGFEYDPARGKFRSYLKTAVLHAVFRHRRQAKGPVQLEEIENATRAAAADATIDEAWEGEWRQYHLRQAMRMIEVEFSPADCAAFQKYAVDGGDARETAATLGLSVDQVYQAKTRILKRLSQIIAAQVADEG